MYEAEKLAANVEIGEDIQTSYEGMFAEINKKVKENEKIQDEIDFLDEDISRNADKSIANYGVTSFIDGNAFTVAHNSTEVQEALNTALEEVGLSIGSTIGDWSAPGSMMTYMIDGLDKLDNEVLQGI